MTQEEKRAYWREYDRAHREKKTAQDRERRKNNLEKYRAKERAYYLANRDKILERTKRTKDEPTYEPINAEEEWRPVKGYEGLYEVSNLARVRSLDTVKEFVTQIGNPATVRCRGRVLKQQKTKNGYMFVQLINHKQNHIGYIHRLVAQAFIPNPDNLPIINHKDECKSNNLPENLEWCTVRYNSNYGTSRQRLSEKRSSRIIEQYSLDGELVGRYIGAPTAARETGLKRASIESALRRKNHIFKGYEWKYAN